MPVSSGREPRPLWPMLTVALVVTAVAGVLVVHAAGRPIDFAAPFDAWTQAVQDLQRRFHAELATAIRAVKANESLALWNLMGLGFLYGVFHAAGPGHGKFVISTYLATSGAGLRRGISLTAASACLQGLTAIAVVELTVGLLNLTFRDARQNAAWIETASYALVALLGLSITALALRRVWRHRRRSNASETHDLGHDHGHHEYHGHAHGPAVNDLIQPLSAARFAILVLSVGIRPCTGAVLVLLFAHALELRLAGIGAVAGISWELR